MPVIVPPPVSTGDTIYVTHPAGRVDATVLEQGVEALRSLGYAVRRDPTLGDTAVFLAGPDDAREADVHYALTAPDVAAAICARGGYGSARLLERLPGDLLARNPRWLVGYSDITALHLWGWTQGVATLHAPMVAGFSKHDDDNSIAALQAALAGKPPTLTGQTFAGSQRVTAALIGGNLSMIAALRNTPWLRRPKDVILFIEEVAEPLYRLDRMLTTLLMEGGLDGVAAFALGQFTECGEPADEVAARARVVELLTPLGVPILGELPVGHGTPNLPFVHGGTYTLDPGSASLAPDFEATATPRKTSRQPRAIMARTRPGRVLELVNDALARGICSAIQLDVSRGAEITHRIAAGATATTPDAAIAPVTPDTRFDIASLTKAVCTAVLVADAVESGLVALDDRCPSDISVASPTLRDLLRHTSGLPALERAFETARSAKNPRTETLERFATVPAAKERVGTQCYSDVGYVALGLWVERVLGGTLAELFASRVAEPLGLRTIGFGDGHSVDGDAATYAATEWCPHRGRTLQGIVHDENCQTMGGQGGHAGLFGRACDVGAIARSLLGWGRSILSESAVAAMWSRRCLVDDGSYVLGWDTPSGPRSNAGSLMTRDATVGHLGFTGTSVWIDRRRQIAITLLTNRVHPARDEARIRELRPAIHDAIMRELGVE